MHYPESPKVNRQRPIFFISLQTHGSLEELKWKHCWHLIYFLSLLHLSLLMILWCFHVSDQKYTYLAAKHLYSHQLVSKPYLFGLSLRTIFLKAFNLLFLLLITVKLASQIYNMIKFLTFQTFHGVSTSINNNSHIDWVPSFYY